MYTSPFVYGKIATDEAFTDREQETLSLKQDFLNLTNTIVISPRRWGKSSLIRKAGKEACREDRKLRVCHLDIFNVRNETEFYEKYATAVLRETSSKIEEIFTITKKYASALIPVISTTNQENTLSFTLKLGELEKDEDEILDLPEKIAKEKGIRIIICIDEFQQTAVFKDPDAFQAKLRSHWQTHNHVGYCLYGSRRHMMIEVFTNKEKPFYKFGKTIFLEKIQKEKWIPFIMEKFHETDRSISESNCRLIVTLTDNNPYYIQQLCEETWNKTKEGTEATSETVKYAFQGIILSLTGLNMALTQNLTLTQQNLLNAIVNGEKELTSQKVLSFYGLKNSLTVSRAKKVLIEKDIIDTFGNSISMEDPMYEWWLKNIYFNNFTTLE